jgi:hypothetical protein
MKMKLLGVIAAVMSLGALLNGVSQGHANTLNISTGLDSSGAVQTNGGALDANWQVRGAPSPYNSPNAYVVAPGDGDWAGSVWGTNGPNSSWIAANPYSSTANGIMTFTLTFDVSNPKFATMSSQWIIDDYGTLSLNGNLLSTNGACGPPCNIGFNGNWPGTWSTFSADPSDFVRGTNVLVAQMLASDFSYEGLRLEGLVDVRGHVAFPADPPSVPLPAALPLFATGLVGLGLLGWRRKTAAAG